MALGLCCQWLATNKKGKAENILISRALQKGRYERGLYTDEHIRDIYRSNLENLRDVLRDKVIPGRFRVFRMSSAMFPLFDLVHDRSLYDNDVTTALFSEIGRLVIDNGIRLTTHPGQFVVLSSQREHVRINAARELEFHGWVFDKMGLPRTPHHAINIHGGKRGETSQLIQSINTLSDAARCRLTLENDEMCWSVNELLTVSSATGVPIVFDSHHFQFRDDDMKPALAMEIASSTWPEDIRPITHLSNTKEEHIGTDKMRLLRQHSDYIYQVPQYQLEANNDGEIDIDVEAKAKNFAIYDAVARHKLSLA